jgi:hypothetical protein
VLLNDTKRNSSQIIRVLVLEFQSVLNKGLKHESRQLIKFVIQPICAEFGLQTLLTPSDYILCGPFTFIQTVKKIVSKHDLFQVMQFAYLRLSCSLTVQKMVSKRNLLQLEEVVIGARYAAHM